MIKLRELQKNRNMCTTSNPSGAMLCDFLGGGAKSLYARLVGSPTNMEVRCKSFSASTFALFFSNEKWKVENGKFLTVMLNLFQHLTGLEAKSSFSLDGRADLRTDDAKLVRIASRLSQLGQSPYGETLGAWSKSKTKVAESLMRVDIRHSSFTSLEVKLPALAIPCQARNDVNISPLLWERIEHSMRSIVSVLGEGLFRREKLNLLLLAGEGWDEVDACCLFITPPAIVVRYTHTIASSPSKEEFVACGDKVNILHDICKNFQFSIFNFPFITKLGGCKSLHDGLVDSLIGLEVGCKSLHFNLGIANTNLDARCKSLHDGLVDSLIGLEVRCKKCLA